MPAPKHAASSPGDAGWLAAFHAGERDVLEACYREHFGRVERSVGEVLTGADRETVIHEVFLRLLANAALRENFRGGSLAAWISTVARNHAIDFVRRAGREALVDPDVAAHLVDSRPEAPAVDAKLLVERFCQDVLPSELAGVFETRFLDGLTQREAAARLGMRRTTLAYHERKVRKLLERYLLGGVG